VPLLLRAPGVSRQGPAITPFGLIDLAPTLLEAIGVSIPGSFHGTSRFRQLQRGENWENTAVFESVAGCTNPFLADKRLGRRILAIREERYKLVLDFGASRELLFDLKADPTELFPLPADAEKPVRRRLLERALQHIVGSLQLRDPDQRLSARLRDLRLEWAHSATKVTT
jgi:arylsulfatase A-like enzyme